MQLWKYRIFNKYCIFAFLFLLIAFFALWVADSLILENLPFTFNYESEMDSGLTFEEAEESRVWRLNKIVLSFDSYMSYSPSINIFLMVLAPMAGMIFFAEKNGFFQYKFIRGKGYCKTVLGSMLINALIIATWVYFAYLIYTTVGILICNPTSDITRPGFEFLMEGFFDNHMYLYYVLNGFVVYFMYSFVYCLFACSISFYTLKKYLTAIIPIIYTLGLSVIIGVASGNKYIQILDFISPISTLGFGTLMTGGDELLRALTPLIPPLLFVAGTALYQIKGSERL